MKYSMLKPIIHKKSKVSFKEFKNIIDIKKNYQIYKRL